MCLPDQAFTKEETFSFVPRLGRHDWITPSKPALHHCLVPDDAEEEDEDEDEDFHE